MTPPNPPSSCKDPAFPPLAAPRRGILRRVLCWLGLGLLGLVMLGMLLWAALAVYYADTHTGPRTLRAWVFVLASSAAVLFIRPRRYGLAAFAVLFLIVLGWFFSLTPSNDRDWAPEVARVPWAQIDGDRVILHNVRNFDYRTETDFTPRWEDRAYDLSQIRSADLMLVYWGSPDIAHAMVSFGFEDGQYLAISIETRKERAESYSTVEGFFRQFELIYIFSDERDVVRLRTNYRKGEEVYLYHTTLTPAQARAAFVSYLNAANELKEKPEFYNALTSNCANNVLEHAQAGGRPGKFTMDIVLSGRAARQAYANGGVDTSLPFDELEKRSRINAAAKAADQDPDFSRIIRAGLPMPAKVAGGASAKPTPRQKYPAGALRRSVLMFNITRNGLMLAVVAAVAGFIGCKASEAPPSGFNPDSHLMTKNEKMPFQRTYWNKKYDSKAYTEILIAPVNMDYVAAQNFWEKANIASGVPDGHKKDLASIAEYTRNSYIRAAADDPKHRFKVVTTAGPKTLILELAITQLVPSKAVLNAIGYVTWIPTAVSVAGSVGTQSEDTGKGVIAIEGRVRDGATGEIIGMFADREHPKTAILDLKSLSWWAPAKAIIDEWSKQLIDVANAPPGGVVKDTPAFELLVW